MAWCRVDGREYNSAAAACRSLGLEVKGNSAVRVLVKAGHVVEKVKKPLLPPPDLRHRLRERLLQLTPQQFERVVGALLECLGFSNIQITGRTGDGGIDGEAAMPFLGVKVGFQAKRWQTGNLVTPPAVRELIGSVTRRGYDRGIFITTSDFTPGAREEADSPNSKVVLVNGERLADIMIERGLGIKTVPLTRQELDEGFFQSL